jgi:hypothetical protein
MSWANSFGDAYKVSRGVARDRALAQDANQPDASPGLATVANPEDMGPQPIDPGTGLESARQGPIVQALDPSQTQAARLSQRASVYRQFGDDAGADKLLANNASLGLTNAQTGEVTQRTAREKVQTSADQLGLDIKSADNDRMVKARKIEADVMAGLQKTDEQGQPIPPSPEELNRARGTVAVQLAQAGLTKEADSAADALRGQISSQIKATSEQRQADIAQLNKEIATGNFSNVPAVVQKYNYGMSGFAGAELHDIKPGPQPGTSVVTYSDQKGDNQQKVVPTSALQSQLLDGLHKLSGDATAVAMADEQLRATINMHKAQAGYYGAHAGQAAAETSLIKSRAAREDTLQTARDAAAKALQVPEEQRTPEQQQVIKANAALELAERMRSGGAAGGAGGSGARTMNGVVGNREVTIRTHADGSSEYMANAGDDKNPTPIWKPISREQAQAAVAAASSASGTPATQPSPSGASGASIPPNPKDRVVGQTYTNPSGQKAVWRGTGWEPLP